MTKVICPKCGSTHTIHDPIRGETFCGKCGLVITIDPPIIESTAGNNYPALILGSHTDFDSPKLRRLQTIDHVDAVRKRRGAYQKERMFAFSEIFRMAAVLHIPPLCRLEALRLYEWALGNTTIIKHKAITIEALATAAIIISMQQHGVIRGFDTITDISKASPQSIIISTEKLKRAMVGR